MDALFAVIVSALGNTVMATFVVALSYVAKSVGVKVTDNVWVPAFKRVPAGGLYVNVPGTLDVALSCEAPRAVP